MLRLTSPLELSLQMNTREHRELNYAIIHLETRVHRIHQIIEFGENSFYLLSHGTA